MTVHDLSEASRRWQKQNIIPPFKELPIKAPLIDTSRFDKQAEYLDSLGWAAVKKQNNRLTEEEWELLKMLVRKSRGR